jgi:hypothetical protein
LGEEFDARAHVEERLEENKRYVENLRKEVMESGKGNWIVTDVETVYGLKLPGKRLHGIYKNRSQAEEFMMRSAIPCFLIRADREWKHYFYYAR